MKKNSNPVGRPPKPINQDLFEELCKTQHTKEEIINILAQNYKDKKFSERRLNQWIKETYDDNFEGVNNYFMSFGKSSLRRKQFELAINKGDSKMLIHLGKTLLDQKETKNIDVSGSLNSDVQVVVVKLPDNGTNLNE